MNTAVASFTTREMGDLVEQIDATGEAGYDGIELAEAVSDEVAVEAALERNQLDLVAIPVDADVGHAEIESVATTARDFDCEYVRVSWLPPAAFESPTAVEHTATKLDDLAESFSDNGVELVYHNHAHEFVDCGEETAYDRLVDGTSTVQLEIDVGWAQLGGADPVDLVERYGDRAGTLHVTDVTPGPVTHDTDTGRGVRLGEGGVDLVGCVGAAREHGIEWACFEGWEPDDPRDWIGHARDVLAELLAS